MASQEGNMTERPNHHQTKGSMEVSAFWMPSDSWMNRIICFHQILPGNLILYNSLSGLCIYLNRKDLKVIRLHLFYI